MNESLRRTRAALAVAGALAAMTLGCSPQPSAVAAVITDKVYTVTPDSVRVMAGIVTGEVTELKITERVEQGSGRVSAPAKLTGKLTLKNVSPDQSVRLTGGRISYVDAQGQPIRLEDNRPESTLKFASSYGTPDRLDPGQDASQPIDAEFPAEALKTSTLKEIRLELSYLPSPYKQETLKFGVSIGGQ